MNRLADLQRRLHEKVVTLENRKDHTMAPGIFTLKEESMLVALVLATAELQFATGSMNERLQKAADVHHVMEFFLETAD